MEKMYYSKLLSNLPVGYGFHKIILDKNGNPYDYSFLDVNSLFEEYTGLKKDDVIGKTVLEVLPDIVKSQFNWIEYYGDIALNDKTGEFIQFSEVLERSYKIKVFSPQKLYFIVLFSDYSAELSLEEQVEESTRIFEKSIKVAPIPIMIHAEDGEVIAISDTWSDISGYSHQDIPTIGDWIKKAYGTKQEELISFIEKLYSLNKRQHDGEFEIKGKNGETYLWDFYSTYLGTLPDNRKLAMSVALDITQSNKMRSDLMTQKQLSEITLLSVGDGIITTDENGLITLLNSAAESLTGWKNKDAVGKNIEEVFNIYSDETGVKCENIVDKVVKLGVTQELANHTILYSADGQKRAIADSASPIRLDTGEIIGVVIVFRDYSEKYQKEAEIDRLINELQDTKILLESSLESTEDLIIISLDKEYRYLYFNKAHSIDMKNAYNKNVKIGDCIFDFMTSQTDIDNIKYNYDIALTGKSHVTLQKYGDIKANYYETKFNPIFDLSGEIMGLTVFAENVTARINMENKLILDEKRYKGLVNNLDVGVVIHGEDTRVISCNPMASLLLGISEDKLTGMFADDPDFEFINEDGSIMEIKNYPVNLIKQSMKPMKEKLLGIKRKQSGDIVWVSVNGLPILDSHENLLEIAISFKNVTETIKNRIALENAAYNDYLTGLHNRRYYEEFLVTLDKEENYPLTIVMADINGLKLINDAFGHRNGDKLLESAAKLLKQSCRKTDLVARIGGDEFVIVMPKTTEKEASKIIDHIKTEAVNIKTQSISLSISFGYIAKKNSTEDIQEIYRSAEDLMYREKLLEIPSMRSSAIETILQTLYEKDNLSEQHSRTVSTLSERIAKALGMSVQDIVEVKTAGLLHDIGKIIIPLSIIGKVGLLSKNEYETIKSHPEIGFRILNSTQNMRGISDIVLNHHERWDGTGYPRGVKSIDIPLKSRIISIADAFDAMTSKRSYRKTISKEAALQEIMRNAGTQFDPDLAKLFEINFKKIVN